MAHFAKLDENNIVVDVTVIDNVDCLDGDGNESEAVGTAFCETLFGGTWKQTSYNTYENIHALGGTPYRKNYANRDGVFDEARDAFYLQQPFPSWTLVESTCRWNSPIPEPDDSQDQLNEDGSVHIYGIDYRWDEDAYQADNSTGWVEVE